MNNCPLCSSEYADSHRVEGAKAGKCVIYGCGTYDHPFMGVTQSSECRIKQQEEQLERLRGLLAKARAQACALGHVVLETGITPGVDRPCRCGECRDAAVSLAEAGYLDKVKDRWWEAAKAGGE